MKRIESKLNTTSSDFQANAAHNRKLAEDFKAMQHRTRNERPERDMQRLKAQDKMFVRQRLQQLLDPGTPFLELSSLAANEAYEGEVPGAGVVTGIGIVSGREVMINAGDASVKGGAWYPLSVKKTVRALDIAIENRLPVVHLCCRPSCSRISTMPAASSATSACCRRWGCSRYRSCSVTAPPAAPMCRPCPTTT
jgi:3-methylcrotonyl-CoA carboxylase beta subunit